MHATKGDQLVQHGRVVGEHDKVAEIVEVMGAQGAPRTGSGSRRTGTKRCARPAPTRRSGTGRCGSNAVADAGQRGAVAGCV